MPGAASAPPETTLESSARDARRPCCWPRARSRRRCWSGSWPTASCGSSRATARTPTTSAAMVPQGPAYELASRFAESLGVPLRLYTVRTRDAAIEEVAAGRAHIAAAGLSTGIDLPGGAQFGPGYQRVREHLIYRRRTSRPAARFARPRAARSRSPPAARTSARSRTCGCSIRTSPGSNATTPTPRRSSPTCRDGNVQYTLASLDRIRAEPFRAPGTRDRARPVARACTRLGRRYAAATTRACSTASTRSSSLRATRRTDRRGARSLLRQGRSLRLPVVAQLHGARRQPPAALRRAGSSRPRSSTTSTGACSRRWVTRNRNGTRAPSRSRACAG